MNIKYLAMGLTVSVLVIAGCSGEPEPGSAEKVEGNGILEKTLDSVKEGVQTTADQIGESANEAGTAVTESVESVKQAASDSAEVIESNIESIGDNLAPSTGSAGVEAVEPTPAANTTAGAVEGSSVVTPVEETTEAIEVMVPEAPAEATVIEEKVEALQESMPIKP